MKRIRLSILFLLILLCSVAFAALTKTTSVDEIDAWQTVSAGTLQEGNAGNISNSYATILYLEIAYIAIATQDGVDVKIEVSYGDDDWTLLTEFTTPSLSVGGTDTTNGEVFFDDTTILLDSAVAFDTPGQKFLIVDPTPGNSEAVRVKIEAAKTVTMCAPLLRGHVDASVVWDTVHDYTFQIPAAFAFVRVLINNTDANADIMFTTRISKVTGL